MRILAAIALTFAAAGAAHAQIGGDPSPLCPEGYEALQAEDAEGAVEGFSECLSERQHEWTEEAELRTRLGAAHLALEDGEEALMAFNQVVALVEENGGNADVPVIRRNRAAAMMQLDRFDDALEELAIARRGDPRDGFTHVLTGSAYMELEREPEAVAAFDEAIRVEPDYLAGWIGRSAAFVEMEMADEAVDDGREAVSIAPEDAGALNALCWALVKAERAREGLDICDAAVEADPESGSIVHSRAAALEQVGRTGEARELFTRAYELDPDNDTIAEDYARVTDG